MNAIERFKAVLANYAPYKWRELGMSLDLARELSSEIDALLAERDRLREQLDDAAMLLRRTARRLPADDPVGSKAVDWMRRNSLQGSPLRGETP
jgi:hypothetical protein